MAFGLVDRGVILPLLNIDIVIVCNNPSVAKTKDCLRTASGTAYSGNESMTESGHYCETWVNNDVSS